MRLPVFMLAAMITYTVGVASYVNIAEATSGDRERGVLKRLAGTPLPRWAYHAGHLTTSLLVTIATAMALTLVAALGYCVRIEPGMIPWMLAAIVAGASCFTVLAALVVAFASKQQTVNAITLGTFLPLAFVSDVFVIGADCPPRSASSVMSSRSGTSPTRSSPCWIRRDGRGRGPTSPW
ncbi:ABC transporter permease [[Actinomadura] parvosata]|uniref:ABC transporter permease n=1 Tax=[Actinomadura] parvosata TaxID=1955412 RepID=UPI00406C8A38